MPTFNTPTAVNQGSYDLTFAYNIDANHSGSLTIHFDSPQEYEQADTVIAESVIAALSASAEWDFTVGFRHVDTGQRIDP